MGGMRKATIPQRSAMLTKRKKHWHGEDWECIHHAESNLQRSTYFYDYELLLLATWALENNKMNICDDRGLMYCDRAKQLWKLTKNSIFVAWCRVEFT